jgi:Sigma-70, region 4
MCAFGHIFPGPVANLLGRKSVPTLLQVNGQLIRRLYGMSIPQAQFGNFDELRCFGRALVQDDRRPLGESVGCQLVEQLLRKAMTVVVSEAGARGSRSSIAVYGRFIELHRRHVWKAWAEEGDFGWPDPALGRNDRRVKSAVQALPLEQREALLLVTLPRFTHEEAAEALDVSLSQFVARLDKARRQLTASFDEDAAADGWDSASHLRIVK